MRVGKAGRVICFSGVIDGGWREAWVDALEGGLEAGLQDDVFVAFALGE